MKTFIAPAVITVIVLCCFFLAIAFFAWPLQNGKETNSQRIQTNVAVVAGSAAAAQPASIKAQLLNEYTPLSVSIFITILVLQLTALFSAAYVIGQIKSSRDSVQLKLKKLSNADIFMDLPLYIGLFGTVSSFIIITFCPQFSRLIAYSSTIIGILISVAIRTVLLFPYRQQLLTVEHASKQTAN